MIGGDSSAAAGPSKGPVQRVEGLGSAAVASYRYLIVGGGMTGAAACKGIREHDSGGLDRALRRGVARSVRAPPAHQGSLEGQAGGLDLARHARARRRHPSRHADCLPRPRGPNRDGRQRRDALVRADPARDRRDASAGRGVGRRCPLLQDARPLPPAAQPRERGSSRRGRRRRVHRLGDRRGPDDERLRRHDRLSRRRASGRRSFPPSSPLSSASTTARRASRSSPARKSRGSLVTGARFASRPRAVARSRPTPSSRASASSRARISRRRAVFRSTMASSSTSAGASDGHEDVFAAGRRRALPGARARRHPADRAREPCEHPRPLRRREHGRRGQAVRLPPVLLLGSLRARLRGDRRHRSRLDWVAEWAEPNRKGVVCYADGGKPRGFLLWDVWDKVDAARELILAGEPVDRAAVRALMD